MKEACRGKASFGFTCAEAAQWRRKDQAVPLRAQGRQRGQALLFEFSFRQLYLGIGVAPLGTGAMLKQDLAGHVPLKEAKRRVAEGAVGNESVG